MPIVTYVGIDVSKDELVCAQWVQGVLTPLPSVPNTEIGFQALAQALADCREPRLAEAGDPIRVIVEPTGGYELRLITWAHARGWQVAVVNSKQVRDWVKGQGQRAKTDALDAQMLARYAADRDAHPDHTPLPLWQPLPDHLAQLDSLVARRREMEQMLLQEHNRQVQYTGRPGLAVAVTRSVTAVTTALTASLAEIDQAIQNLIDHDSDIQEQLAHLDSIPGVGDKTVLPLFVLLARWHVLTGGCGSAKALTAFVGLDAHTHQSGHHTRRGGISKTGDPELRRLLFMAALGGKRKHGDNPLRRFYERLVGRGKLRMVALVAAARKILIWAWAVFRSHTDFDPAKHAQGA